MARIKGIDGVVRIRNDETGWWMEYPLDCLSAKDIIESATIGPTRDVEILPAPIEFSATISASARVIDVECVEYRTIRVELPPLPPAQTCSDCGETLLYQCIPDECPMCTGEACNKCGAGCWNPTVADCDHDVLERHHPCLKEGSQPALPPSPTEE